MDERGLFVRCYTPIVCFGSSSGDREYFLWVFELFEWDLCVGVGVGGVGKLKEGL